MAEPTVQRKVTWPMLAVGGGIFLGGGLWMVSIVSSLMPSHADQSRRAAAREPQVYVYIANNGGESKPPTVFAVPTTPYATAPTRWEPPPERHLYQQQSPVRLPNSSPRFQQVQLPVYSPEELPSPYTTIHPRPDAEAYRDQFPNACKPQIWNPRCEPVEDSGWEEVEKVPEKLTLPQVEQWTKVGSYLCIQHAGYYGPSPTRCWQRT